MEISRGKQCIQWGYLMASPMMSGYIPLYQVHRMGSHGIPLNFPWEATGPIGLSMGNIRSHGPSHRMSHGVRAMGFHDPVGRSMGNPM